MGLRINSKKELKFYIMSDRMMNFGYFEPSFKQRIVDIIWPNPIKRFLLLMRKCQYYNKLGGG